MKGRDKNAKKLVLAWSEANISQQSVLHTPDVHDQMGCWV